MEVIKELCVATADIDCIVKSENRFHLNLSSFFESLTNTNTPVYVGITRFHMPLFRRCITFSACICAVGTDMLEKDFKEFSCNYSSFDELCMFLSSCFKDFPQGSVSFSYLSTRFKVTVDSKYYLVVSCNLAKLMCLENEIVATFSVAKQKSSSRSDLITEFSYPLKISSSFVLGEPCEFLSNGLRYCNFVFNSLTDVNSLSNSGRRNCVAFSYDMIERRVVNSPLKRLNSCVSNNLSFSILADNMRPYPFEIDLNQLDIGFCLQFILKI